jgi:hypothetical protein
MKTVSLILDSCVVRIGIEGFALSISTTLLAQKNFILNLTIDSRTVTTRHDLPLVVNGL